MSQALAKPTPTSLKALTREIQDEYLMFVQAGTSTVEHAIRVGELLIEAKDQLKHGGWLPWLEENFEFTPRWAQVSMKLSRNANAVSHLSAIPAALAELAAPRDPEPDPQTKGEPPASEPADLEPDDPEPEVVDGEVVEDGAPEPSDPTAELHSLYARFVVLANELLHRLAEQDQHLIVAETANELPMLTELLRRLELEFEEVPSG